jgi:hypothetical protein
LCPLGGTAAVVGLPAADASITISPFYLFYEKRLTEVTQYSYERALKGPKNVHERRETRFAKQYPGFEVEVLDAAGHTAHGRTLLTTVRDTYLEE